MTAQTNGSLAETFAETDGSGSFRLGPFRPGAFQVIVHSADWLHQAQVEVHAGDLGVEIRLEPRGLLSGSILDEEGRVVRVHVDVTVTATGSSTGSYSWGPEADAEGGYSISSFPPGTYDVSAVTSDGRLGSLPAIQVPGGKRLDNVDITVRPGSHLQVVYFGVHPWATYRVLRKGVVVRLGGLQRGVVTDVLVPHGDLEIQTKNGDEEGHRTVHVEEGSEEKVLVP